MGAWVVATAAACESEGIQTRTCRRNGCSYLSVEKIEAVGHSWNAGTITTPASCSTEGVSSHVCANNSGHTKTEPVEPIDHDWGEWVVLIAATTKSEGLETNKCRRTGCGQEETQPISPLSLTPFVKSDRYSFAHSVVGYNNIYYISTDDQTKLHANTIPK